MWIGLLAQPFKNDVQFIGVIDGWNQDSRFVRRSVSLGKNRNGLRGVAHEEPRRPPHKKSRAEISFSRNAIGGVDGLTFTGVRDGYIDGAVA